MPPKAKLSKQPTARAENAKKKLKRLFEEHEATVDNAPKVRIQNIVNCFNRLQSGYLKYEQLRKLGEVLITEKLNRFDIFATEPVKFERRITAMQFHPSEYNVIAIGAKTGTLIVRYLRKHISRTNFMHWEGIGPGGSITDICFNPFSPYSLFCTSIDGTVKLRNYLTSGEEVLLNTGNFESWYCSVNVSHVYGLVMAGDTNGNVRILNKDLKETFCHKLHKKKVNSLNFSKHRDWLFASASLDSTVKLWDVRKIDPKYPLHTLPHLDPVNSAFFSRTNGDRLLTTDQRNEIRVYKGHYYDLESRIPHPHRQFQHLTPIKATWHPLSDIIVVGRYPDPNWPTYRSGELNTIDLISADTRETVVQLFALSAAGIASLNCFNSNGEFLASAMGLNLLYRKEKDGLEKSGIKKPGNGTGGGPLDDDDDDDPSPKRKRTKTKSAKNCPKSKMSKLKSR